MLVVYVLVAWVPLSIVVGVVVGKLCAAADRDVRRVAPASSQRVESPAVLPFESPVLLRAAHR